ncbi:site-specific DNA-methyltransferase [Apibacter sp. B2912]|uniref:site-specific DNA-methyltransferase n=1 Tax=Apibacter sp. B2912 TaxID=2656763 RepID=UPI00136C3258|nr:site-specific DNA-methyltransferase [Apibacter sp. B2912]MXO32168.1 site-specific DNA-methyltransferase [Apibacter sp. B2912]
MPTLHWIGKEKVINHHQEVPFRILEKQYTYTNGTQTEEKEKTSENKIIHGDNLEALKSLLPEYEGKIKCIYIDPPYNTGNEGWVYNDNVNDPKIKKWLGQVVGKESEDLSRHDKWLCMMYPRLKLLHKLLANDGAIFISIDDNEQANLKLICDEIYGAGNFVNNIIWQKKTGASDAKTIANIIEYVLIYSKNNNVIFNKNKESYDLKRYKYKDEFFEQRGPYYIDNLDRGGLQYSDSLNFKIKCPDGTFTYPNGRKEYFNDGWIWKWGKEKIKWALQNNFLEFRKSKNKKSGWAVCYKNYLKVDNTNITIERAAPKKNLITDVLNANAASDLKNLFDNKNVFNYSKPVNLIYNILNFIKYEKNSIILDSFAGSGTTAHAVLNLNKQDGGNRKFILVEMEDYAESITAERVKRVISGYGEENKAVEGTGGDFSYYELGKPLFLEENILNEEVGEEKIREYIWYSEVKTPYQKQEENYLLGKQYQTAYYFYYDKEKLTTLDENFLRTLKTKAEQYIIYADNCLLDADFMNKHSLIFKKIPRDITRF